MTTYAYTQIHTLLTIIIIIYIFFYTLYYIIILAQDCVWLKPEAILYYQNICQRILINLEKGNGNYSLLAYKLYITHVYYVCMYRMYTASLLYVYCKYLIYIHILIIYIHTVHTYTIHMYVYIHISIYIYS